MKKNKLIYALSMMCISLFMLQACSDDDSTSDSSSGVQFQKVATTLEESGGTITIPIRGGSVSGVELEFDGTATEGEDFEVVDITNDALEIQILDDGNYEDVEYARVRMVGNGVGGNAFTTINILCDGGDSGGFNVASYAGSWSALEDYGGGSTFGPYNVTLTQDGANPNKFTFPNFYGSGATYTAYMIFDLASGTVSFPDQTVGAPANNRGPITNSTGTYDLCENTLTINLTYDGGPWVYRFTKN